MLHSCKSKFNVQEIKVQLTDYLKNHFTDIKVYPKVNPGYYFTHFFSGVDLKTKEVRYFRVSYVETWKWARKWHVFRVEFLTLRGHWERL